MNQAVKSSLRSQVSDAIEEYDYEAIEQAVMESPRGRWFLREYLKRHREADTTRLAEAMQRLAQAMHGTAERQARDATRQLRALVQDALAEAATELSRLFASQDTESTPPGLAASRLEALLQQLRSQDDSATPAAQVLSILESLFARLSGILGEPRPRLSAAPQPDDAPRGVPAAAPASSPHPQAEARATGRNGAAAPQPQKSPQAQPQELRPAASSCAPCRPRLRIEPRAPQAAAQPQKSSSVRINIQRRQPQELHIPMPRAGNTPQRQVEQETAPQRDAASA